MGLETAQSDLEVIARDTRASIMINQNDSILEALRDNTKALIEIGLVIKKLEMKIDYLFKQGANNG